MNREFLDLYNRELQLLNEQAREFADEYPGHRRAARRPRRGPHRPDDRRPARRRRLPRRARAAQAQARVSRIHQQSARAARSALSRADALGDAGKGRAAFGDPALRDGRAIARGSYLDATYRERDRSVACRYRLCGDITLWPFDVTGAEYFTSAGAAAGARPVRRAATCGRAAALAHPPHRGARREDEPPTRRR